MNKSQLFFHRKTTSKQRLAITEMRIYTTVKTKRETSFLKRKYWFLKDNQKLLGLNQDQTMYLSINSLRKNWIKNSNSEMQGGKKGN